ncbi:putative DnaJ domain, Chaperone J-domain superfamily [Helianthus anomalus]
MDPHSFIARAEAQRWLGIAEKLLISHDLVGSKTFAIRARESDPRLEPAEQILAIADTLLAAEKRVVGTNGSHQPDYYAILQLVRFVQDTEHISAQYRRLAVLLNPHQNRFPYADQAFQLVNDAWAVLSNPMRKSMYDSDLDYPQQQQMNNLGFNIEQQQQQQHQQQHHQQQQPHNFFSINQELPEQQQTFQSRLHQQQQQQQQHQQLQQHNFLSQPNPVRPLPVREQEHMFQHREQEHLFQPQVQPFQVTSPPHQQSRVSPQPNQQQSHIQSPPQSPFSWPGQMSQQKPQQSQFQHHQIKQEQHQHHQIKQEQQMKHEQQLQQQMKQQQEQLKQQQLQQEQLKQKQLQEEQRKQQQMLEEQRKQQQMLEEQRKQQQMLEEQRKQQQMLEEQRKQQQLLEEQRKQQQLLEEQRKQQQLLEEQRKQQQLLEEQRKQQQILEEQRKQQQLLEEQRKQQQLLEEQRKQQQLQEELRKQEEQRKQQQLLEEQRKQQQLLEEQRKQQQLQEEQRKQQQLLEEQRKQQQLQEEQRKQQEQQQQESLKHNAAPVQPPGQVNSNNGVREEETETETETEPVDDSPTFWTACPYCFYMYEYPRVYVECTLRCDNCKRAFQAVRISAPPPIIEGQDAYFYCWGFFPLGLSMPQLQGNNKGPNSNWTPFSSLHNASNNTQNHLNEQAAPKANPFVNKSSGPRIYIDDITDNVFIGVSDPSSDSDIEWNGTIESNGTKKQKSKRVDEGFKERIQVLALRAMYTNGSDKNLKHGVSVQDRVEVPTVLVVETNKKNAGSNPRTRSGRVAQEMGKLDLNVEFNNNEREEAARTRAHEQGEDNSEGVEFFEGLDEYLSSLPILSVVNEEKSSLSFRITNYVVQLGIFVVIAVIYFAVYLAAKCV